MGAVYEALHESIERRVALKVLHPEHARNPEAVSRFFNEARAVNRIEHPNIVQVSEFGQADDGSAYLVMEYLRGETLSARLDALATARQCMRPVEAVQIATQLADALAAAHEKEIVHRDLKPGNVMLLPEVLSSGGERVKLLDFGIAKLMQGGGGKATNTHAVMGTPQYMSPEQCKGAGGVDDRTDVYALGVMLYEMLAGQPPFVAENALGYVAQHVYKEPPPLASLALTAPPELPKLVHRLLSKDKGVRPAMREVRTELMQMLATLSGSTAATRVATERRPLAGMASSGPPSTLGNSQGQALPSQPGRRKAIHAAALLGLLGIAGGAGHVLLRSVPNRPAEPVSQPGHVQTEPPAGNNPSMRTEPPARTERSPAVQPASKPLAPQKAAPVAETPPQLPPRRAVQGLPRPASKQPAPKRAVSPSPPAPSRKFVD